MVRICECVWCAKIQSEGVGRGSRFIVSAGGVGFMNRAVGCSEEGASASRMKAAPIRYK